MHISFMYQRGIKMKDGKYEIGDVIAFRVVSGGPKWDEWVITESGNILGPHMGTPISDVAIRTLERIPNPQLMEGEWWEGWTWQKWNGTDELPSGAMILVGGNTSDYQCWNNGGEIVPATEGIRTERPVLIPPKSSPCPELKAKIDALERRIVRDLEESNRNKAELAELKKQALGKEGN